MCIVCHQNQPEGNNRRGGAGEESKKDLSKQVAPPRKSKGERARAVRDDKGEHHKWADGRTKRIS